MALAEIELEMTKKQFINALANGTEDILALLLRLLDEQKISYCVIGGLAVNAYADPVVSLDLDIVLASDALQGFCGAAELRGFVVEHFTNSTNLKSPNSDLRVQLQTDPRYQEFLKRSMPKNVLGYDLNVATIEDVLRGKSWAYLDSSRRASKRQKDLADIMRLVETRPDLRHALPNEIQSVLAR